MKSRLSGIFGPGASKGVDNLGALNFASGEDSLVEKVKAHLAANPGSKANVVIREMLSAQARDALTVRPLLCAACRAASVQRLSLLPRAAVACRREQTLNKVRPPVVQSNSAVRIPHLNLNAE